MKAALIGYTGFVGSNLAAQHDFTDLYNSKNIADIDGKSYGLVVCAGARAEKWRINREPEKDWEELSGLINHLKKVKAKKFVLISTVDVYKNPVDVNEDTSIDTKDLHPYGLHRYKLEQFVRDNFDSLIIRLPGLFGPGLKKNIVYDFMHDNNVDRIHHAGEYQYYDLTNLWNDITSAQKAGLKLVNFATEPVKTSLIAKECFGIDFTNEPEGMTAGRYDMHSNYAAIFSGKGAYLYSQKQQIDAIKRFVDTQIER